MHRDRVSQVGDQSIRLRHLQHRLPIEAQSAFR